MRPFCRVHWLAFAACLTGRLIAQTPGADPTPTFRSEVAVVKTDVKVSMPDGADVHGLTKDDFVLYDEGQPQSILDFNRESDPLDVVLVLDVSGSMYRPMSELARSVREALAQLRPGDEAAVLLFGTRHQVVQPFTTDFIAVQKAMIGNIYKQTLGSGTLINEAVAAAADLLASRQAKRRRSLVVVTDNLSDRGTVTGEAVLRALSAADAVVSAVLVGEEPGPGGVREFARATGGEAVQGNQVGSIFKDIVGSLRTRYTLQYSPSAIASNRSYRRIRVDLAPGARSRYPGAKVESRAGYYTNQ